MGIPDNSHVLSGLLKPDADSGGWAWSPARKEEYVNYLGDPVHLIAVTKGANRSKGANRPEERGLMMTQREMEAGIEMLATCEDSVEIKAERAEGVAGTDTSVDAGSRRDNGNTDFSAGIGTRREHFRVWVV